MSTVRKLGVVVMVGLTLALGACTSSTAPSPTPPHFTATAMVRETMPRDAAYRPGPETTQPSSKKHGTGTTAAITSCTAPTCSLTPTSVAVASRPLNAQSSPAGRLVPRWSRQLREPIVISDGLVLSWCGTGCVAADYVTSGARRWVFVDHKNSDIWGLAGTDGVVLVAAGHLRPNSCSQCAQFSQVYRIDALDEASGRLLWTLPIRPDKTSEPIQWLPAVISDHVAVVQLTNGVALGVGLRSGRVLWRSGRPASYCSPQPPAGAVPEVVLVGCSGRVEALDPATGRVLWTVPSGSASGSVGGAVEVATNASSGVVAIELDNDGAPRGVPSFESAFEKENSPWDMTSVVGVSASTGQSRWSLTDVAQEPVVFGDDDSLCVQAFAGVECRSASTGRLRWSLATPYVQAGYSVQELWNPIYACGDITYVVRPGAGRGLSVTKGDWFLESLTMASGAHIGLDTLLPKVPPDPYGTPMPPSVRGDRRWHRAHLGRNQCPAIGGRVRDVGCSAGLSLRIPSPTFRQPTLRRRHLQALRLGVQRARKAQLSAFQR